MIFTTGNSIKKNIIIMVLSFHLKCLFVSRNAIKREMAIRSAEMETMEVILMILRVV